MSERDWNMLMAIPPEWDMLADIYDFMLWPFNAHEIERIRELNNEMVEDD